MNSSIEIQNRVFSKFIDNFGSIHLRYMDFNTDIDLIHSWVTQPYASYWGMLNKSKEAVRLEYSKLLEKEGYEVFIGIYQGDSIFIMEKYKASSDQISKHFEVKSTDYGMHVLVAPPKQKIHGFTWNVFSTIMDYFFSKSNVNRVVVEPDVKNEKIHVLNKKAGFKYEKQIKLPEKIAVLAFCEQEDYETAKKQLLKLKKRVKFNNQIPTKIDAPKHLSQKVWEKVNHSLVKKAISEFAHELILLPKKIKDNTLIDKYYIISDNSEISYEFQAKKRALDHWDINLETLVKKHNNAEETIDALKFIIEFRKTLGIPEHLLTVYLEEISSTLSSAAYKYSNAIFTSKSLASKGFQDIEHAMTEGHPCFVANNGRIGFNEKDYIKYAPETYNPLKMYWLAGHKSKTTFTASQGIQYKSLIRKEIGDQKIAAFNSKLEALGLEVYSYVFIPVHPWQWYNKLTSVFAGDIANQNLVFLGEGNDYYSAQQSIRTLYNESNPNKMYTKTALSILNMGFLRGLSTYYMKSTPDITTWITNLLEKDYYLKQVGFKMLGEVATVGFENTVYQTLGKSSPHNKMLSALWRESPHSKIKSNQQLMTMAALLHLDNKGYSFLSETIKGSGLSTKKWIKEYLKCYLSPLLHCFYTYELVFMPHGENCIMVMENKVPVSLLMKDITEEVIVFDATLKLPKNVERLYTNTSDKMKVLSIFTDVFDCFFRFLSNSLEKHLNYNEAKFWKQVADCIYNYQEHYPNLQSKYDRYDLFVPEFDRCCLNRLQLRNTKQMLNLADPIESLILEGTLENPIAKFKKTNKKQNTSVLKTN